jgi:UDP:flavonoid glycosyltransferase YjiC (YdhE family)
MTKLLQCWELGNGFAYPYACLDLAKVHDEAGYEVVLAMRDLSHAERLFGDRYAAFQAPTPVFPVPNVLKFPMTAADLLHNQGFGDASRMLGRVRAWRRLIEAVKPDYLRCMHSPGALLAARGMGIPTLASGTGFLIPPAVSPLPNLRPWEPKANPQAMAAREARVLEELNKVLTALGSPKLETIGGLYKVDLCEVYSYPEMDEFGPRQDVEYMGLYQVPGATPLWPSGNGKRILAYLELFKNLPAVLEALKNTGAAVLVFLPQVPDELVKKYAGSNLAFAAKPLDLLETSRQCDLGVSHGGHNIALSLLLAGKPQLCMPMFLPERLAAENVLKLGAGLMATLEPAQTTEALTKLLQTDRYAKKAGEFAAKHSGFEREVWKQGMVEHADLLTKKGGAKRAKK